MAASEFNNTAKGKVYTASNDNDDPSQNGEKEITEDDRALANLVENQFWRFQLKAADGDFDPYNKAAEME